MAGRTTRTQQKGFGYMQHGGHVEKIVRHLERFTAVACDRYGPVHSAMWVSSVALDTGAMPEAVDPQQPRVYRLIHAPRGSTLYWDLPLLVACRHLADLCARPELKRAADAYVTDFMRFCISSTNGLFLWGNHIYYDVIEDRIVRFSGGHHELRPLPPAWDLLWECDPGATERAVEALGNQHVHDPRTGAFCRHASVDAVELPGPKGEDAMPFLEAGGVLVESLCWLAQKCGAVKREQLTALARRVASYSFAYRSETTGLVRNQPVKKRWDYHATTTEIGFWGGCLLRAFGYSGDRTFLDLAARAVKAYLSHGWQSDAGKFAGMLDVATGASLAERTTAYQPEAFANVWEFLFPTHDYPMPFAEACIDLYTLTRDTAFLTGVRRWVTHVRNSLPPRNGNGAYAEQYGRCIHFLLRAASVLEDSDPASLARDLARDAVSHLWCETHGMFRSHPGEDRADAVDGLGILFLALAELETGAAPRLLGFAF